jgi:hypothetical protein
MRSFRSRTVSKMESATSITREVSVRMRIVMREPTFGSLKGLRKGGSSGFGSGW